VYCVAGKQVRAHTHHFHTDYHHYDDRCQAEKPRPTYVPTLSLCYSIFTMFPQLPNPTSVTKKTPYSCHKKWKTILCLRVISTGRRNLFLSKINENRQDRRDADRHRLLGVLRVKSHAHWMVIQVVKGARHAERTKEKTERENRFGGHWKIKITYSYWLPFLLLETEYRCSSFVRVSMFFGLEVNTGFCRLSLFIAGASLVCRVPGRCSFVLCCCTCCADVIGYNSYRFDGLNCS
jgi:hypothetical protein